MFGYSVADDGFFQLLNRDSQYFHLSHCKLGNQKGKKHTGRVVNQLNYEIEHAYCIESSFHGWKEKRDAIQDDNDQDSDSEDETTTEVTSTQETASPLEVQKLITGVNLSTIQEEPVQEMPKETPPKEKDANKVRNFTQASIRQAGADVFKALKLFADEKTQNEVEEMLASQKKKQLQKLYKQEMSDSDEDIEFKGAKSEEAGMKFEKLLEKKSGFETVKPQKVPPKLPLAKQPQVQQLQLKPPQSKVPTQGRKIQSVLGVKQSESPRTSSQRVVQTPQLERPERFTIVRPRIIQSSVMKKPEVRISYEKKLDINKEKQKFEYDFYSKFNAPRFMSSKLQKTQFTEFKNQKGEDDQ